MFRLWGKIWKDNHLLKDTVSAMTPKIRGPTRFFVVWKVSVMKWIWETQSGWNLQSDILRNMEKPDFIRIIL